MRVFKSFFAVTVASAIISVVCSLIGIVIAILAGTPVGSTIVAADIVAFGRFYSISLSQGRGA
jgi:zinc transport system permease protein